MGKSKVWYAEKAVEGLFTLGSIWCAFHGQLAMAQYLITLAAVVELEEWLNR